MSTADILSQDEIDALLGGMEGEVIDTEPEPEPEEGEIRGYDFTSQDRIVRGRMPTLEMVNERFARNFRISLFNFLRQTIDVSVGNVQLLKFSEYMQGLFVPANMNFIKCRPLKGTALFNLDARLVFSTVDSYFGGNGRFHAKIEGRDFTPTELRTVSLVLERVFADLADAWSPVMALTFEHVGSETNPQLANIVTPTEVVVVTTFVMELDAGGGELHIAMPYSMIEPIRELLDAGVQSDRSEQDARWSTTLREELETAEVEVVVGVGGVKATLDRLLRMQPGDVLPVDLEQVIASVEDVPVLRGRFGASKGQLALKVTSHVRSESTSNRLVEA